MPTASNYDSAWKDALESYFPEFMALLWPALHSQIDWRTPPVFLDKELQALLRSAQRGRRHVDKLVSVRLLSGRHTLLLIHVEVQAGRETGFAHRMYTYYTRLYEKHPQKHIVSLAVLTDVRAKVGDDHRGTNHPQHDDTTRLSHHAQFWNCSLSFTFPVVYLESWRPRMDELLGMAPSNPFAVVMLGQLEASATRPDAHRLIRKTELVRRLYHWGYPRDNVNRLLRIIDALMALPEALEPAFEDAILQIEEETQMSYVTSIERVRLKREREEGREEGHEEGRAQGREEGRQEGISVGKTEGFAMLLSSQIARKFGALPDWAKVRLVAADDATLNRWAEQILDAQCIEDVFK